MLPINRWPEYLWRYLRAYFAPIRTAVDLNRRLERQWSVSRKLNSEVQAARENHAVTVRQLTAELDRLVESDEGGKRTVDSLKSMLDSEQETVRGLRAELEAAEQRARDFESSSRDYAEQLQAEKDRHRGTADNLDREVAKNQVLVDQLQILVQWREKELQRLEAEARIEKLRGRGRATQSEE